MTFSLVVFDLDGTLVDSRKDISDAANLLLESCGAAPLSEETIAGMVGTGIPDLVQRAFAAAGCEPPAGALDRYVEIYSGRLLAHTRPYPGIRETLAALAQRTALAILTNKPRGATREILAGLDLACYFSPDRVFGGDGPFPCKPDPAGLLRMAADAGVGVERTLLVGDSLIDWQTARRAGARICMARYGFGFKGFPAVQVTAGDLLIDAPVELLSL